MDFLLRTRTTVALSAVTLFTLLVILAQPALARQDDLFSVRVAVPDQSAQARHQALREGLRRVVVKLTGDSTVGIDRLPRGGSELEDYVIEYLYQSPLVADGHETGLDLVARFVPGSVDRLVRSLGLPLWPASRPRVLVWVVADTDEGPVLVNPARLPRLNDALATTFEERAVPMRQPMLDLEDQFALPPEEAWERDAEQLATASRRYGSATVLLLRLVPPESVRRDPALGAELPTTGPQIGDAEVLLPEDEEPWWASSDATGAEPETARDGEEGDWRGDWLLLTGEEVFADAVAGGPLEAVVAASLDRALDSLARTQAYLPGGDQADVRLELSELYTFEDFARAESLLRDIEVVSRVRLVSVERDRARFELTLDGGREVLLQSLRNSEHFVGGENGPAIGARPALEAPTASQGAPGEGSEDPLLVGPEGSPLTQAPATPQSALLQFSWVP